MSGYTYYQYKDVKVNIAHRLFNLEGWTVYGYHANNSDPYTDYYDPASWSGIATKNGFTLVVDHSSAAEEYRRTYTVYSEVDPTIKDKIAKLEKMTTANGASEAEEATAKAAIKKLQEKKQAGEVTKEEYTPGHMANPPRCNWHIEKDGIIIDKGTGLLKFADVPDISQDSELKEWQDYNNKSKEDIVKEYSFTYMYRWNATEEEANRQANYYYDRATEKYKLLEQFNILINRFNTVAGGMVGNTGENGYRYEARKETKYKKVYKFQATESGTIKEGQCFRLVNSFNYCRHAGTVYRFVKFGESSLKGERVSLKNNKNLTGHANSQNHFGYYSADLNTPDNGREQFLKWVANGSIEYGEVIEVMEPYEVEKYVKVDANGNEYKPTKATKEATPAADHSEAAQETTTKYIITADTDTRDNSSIYVVKLSEHVSKEEFNNIRSIMRNLGGYYSRFKSGFIFREDPTEKLNPTTGEAANNNEVEPQEQPEATTETTAEAAQAEAPQNEATEEPTPEAEPKKSGYGYTGPASDFFTPDEIAQLLNGEQIKKGEGYRKHAYIATNYKSGIKFVYSLYLGEHDTISPKNNADFAGFIYKANYYTDFSAIIEELTKDINTELINQVPTEEAAERNAVDLDEYQVNNLENYKKLDFTKEAINYFIEDTKPELILYASYRSINLTDALNYLLDPCQVVADFAKDYKRAYRTNILEKYIAYNRTCAALKVIKANKSHPAHMLKSIYEATKGGEEKTFKLKLVNGYTVKVEADAVRRLAFCGYISSYNVAATDRQYLNRDKYNHAEDIKPEEILYITHGAKTIYHQSKTAKAA